MCPGDRGGNLLSKKIACKNATKEHIMMLSPVGAFVALKRGFKSFMASTLDFPKIRCPPAGMLVFRLGT